MKTYYFSLQKISAMALVGFFCILAISCGSYQTSRYDSDGIYGAPEKATTDNTNRGNTSADTNGYKNYFNSLQSQPEIFTDVDGYNSGYDNSQQNGNQEYSEGYPGWGSNNDNVRVNVYDNNWGYNYWNSWNIGLGWGWNSFYGPSYGCGFNSWYNPYGCGLYGGYYGYGNGYYGNYYYNHGRRRSVYSNSHNNYSYNAGRSYSSNNNGRRNYNTRTYGTTRNNIRSQNNGNPRTNYFYITPRNSQPTTRNNTTRNNNYTPRSDNNSTRNYNNSGNQNSTPAYNSGSTNSGGGRSSGGGGRR